MNSKVVIKYIFIALIFIAIGIYAGWIIVGNLNECKNRADYKLKVFPKFSKSYRSNYSYDYDMHIPKDFVINEIVPLKIKGKIINKFRDKCNHNQPIIDITYKNYYIPVHTDGDFRNDNGLYDASMKGDSIFKNPNSLIFSIKRGDSIKNFKVSPLEEYWVNPYYTENCKKLPVK
jgi:hypothetical protein